MRILAAIALVLFSISGASQNTRSGVSTISGVSTQGYVTASGPGYAYERAITIDHTKTGTASSSNFPVYFPGGSFLATVANGGQSLSSGNDIAYYADSALTTALSCEQVSWNASTGVGEWHISIPTLSSSTDTVIYVAYGKSGLSSSACTNSGVWDSRFRFVSHLPNGTTLSIPDSTSFGNNGTANSASAGAGIVGVGSASFDGANTGKITTPYAEQLGDFTASAWFKSVGSNASSGYDRILEKNYRTGFVISRTGMTSNSWSVYFEDPSASSPLTISLTDGSWHLIKIKRSGSTLTIVGDGGAVSNSVTVSTTNLSSDTLNIGWSTAGDGYNSLNGFVDEPRMMNVATSSSWDTAEFNNQSSPSTFYSIGTQQPGH